MIVIHK